MFESIKRHLRNYKQEIVDDVRTENEMAALRQSILSRSEDGVSSERLIAHGDVVVSLTTFGSRIHDVCLVVESLFRQTVKANRIVLWLDEDEFRADTLPMTLQRQCRRGLEVRFCKNYRSYKKLIPSLMAFPDDAVITVDDDFLYPYDFVERLVAAYRQAPQFIHFVRGCLIRLDASQDPLPYEKWGKIRDNMLQGEADCSRQMLDAAPLSFPTGGAGAIYPPHALHPDVVNPQLFGALCPTADDIWFKVMSLANGTMSRLVAWDKPFKTDFLCLPLSVGTGLFHVNVGKGANDEQMQRVWARYKGLCVKHL